MYTVPPTKSNQPPSYARGLGFIAAALPLMMAVAWAHGQAAHTLVFYGLSLVLIPLCLSGWPIAVIYARRQSATRLRAVLIGGLAVAGPLGYLAVLISGNIIGHRRVLHMVYAVDRSIFESSFKLELASWIVFWLEVAIAWTVIMLAVIFILRRWLPAPENDADAMEGDSAPL